MKQPELGKKVNALRNAKGLTQDELATACNLNVRTIQRIESSEVNPRMYTVRLIFSVLEFEASRSFKQQGVVNFWLEQMYNYTLELFNLKTNTMKKITILSTPALLCLVVLFFTSFSASAQHKKKIKADFDDMNVEFIKWFNAGQIDSIGTMYHIHATFMPTGSPELKGREAIEGYYYFLYNAGFRFTENKSNDITIKKDLVIDKGTWRIKTSTTEEIYGNYLSNWCYIDNKWYIDSEMSTIVE